MVILRDGKNPETNRYCTIFGLQLLRPKVGISGPMWQDRKIPSMPCRLFKVDHTEKPPIEMDYKLLFWKLNSLFLRPVDTKSWMTWATYYTINIKHILHWWKLNLDGDSQPSLGEVHDTSQLLNLFSQVSWGCIYFEVFRLNQWCMLTFQVGGLSNPKKPTLGDVQWKSKSPTTTSQLVDRSIWVIARRWIWFVPSTSSPPDPSWWWQGQLNEGPGRGKTPEGNCFCKDVPVGQCISIRGHVSMVSLSIILPFLLGDFLVTGLLNMNSSHNKSGNLKSKFFPVRLFLLCHHSLNLPGQKLFTLFRTLQTVIAHGYAQLKLHLFVKNQHMHKTLDCMQNTMHQHRCTSCPALCRCFSIHWLYCTGVNVDGTITMG